MATNAIPSNHVLFLRQTLNTFLKWKKDVDLFFEELTEVKDDDTLLRSIIEQYGEERRDDLKKPVGQHE